MAQPACLPACGVCERSGETGDARPTAFFHTDPHPGNLAVDGGFPGGRLIFYDLGQASELPEAAARGAARTVRALAKQDARALVDALGDIGMLREGANRDALERTIRANFAKAQAAAEAAAAAAVEGGSTSAEEIGLAAKRAAKAAAASADADADARGANINDSLQFPSTLAFAARAITQMVGVGRALDADFDFVELAAPFVEERGFGGARGGGARAGGARGGGGGLGGWLAELRAQPRRLEETQARCDELEAAEAQLRARARDAERRLATVEARSAARSDATLALVLVQTSLALGAVAAAPRALARAPLALAAVLGLRWLRAARGGFGAA